nr:unnamed protein product [Callosobruchus chinensis]
MAGQGQRIIVPKGIFKAEETNVIEIPVHLQNSSVVVAQQPQEAPPGEQAMQVNGGCIPTCVNYNAARSRQPIAAGFDPTLLDLPATPPVPPPRTRRPSQQAYRSPGRRFDLSESVQSGMSWGDDSRSPNTTPYAQFAVEAADRCKEMAGSTPKDRSLQDNADWMMSPPMGDFYDGQNYYKPHPRAYRPPGTVELNWPDGTQTRRKLEGTKAAPNAPWPKTPVPPSTATEEKMKLLDQMEFVEQDQLMDDLRNYQKTRRRLIYDVVNMSSLIETPID